jgi:hypothetical protein
MVRPMRSTLSCLNGSAKRAIDLTRLVCQLLEERVLMSVLSSSRTGIALAALAVIGCGTAEFSEISAPVSRAPAEVQLSPTREDGRRSGNPRVPEKEIATVEIAFSPAEQQPDDVFETEAKAPPAPIARRATPHRSGYPGRLPVGPGRELDVFGTFDFDRYGVETALSEQNRVRNPYSRNVELRYPTGKPFLVLGRENAQFHGLTLSYYENGDPMTCAAYDQGRRHGNFMTWDEARRPIYFAQYRRGVKQGIGCLYQPCSPECRESHLLLVQEWDHDSVRRSHLISNNQVALTFDHDDGLPSPSHPTLTASLAALADFERGFDESEHQVEEWLLGAQRQIAEKIKLERRKRIVRSAQQRKRQGIGGVLAFHVGGPGGRVVGLGGRAGGPRRVSFGGT